MERLKGLGVSEGSVLGTVHKLDHVLFVRRHQSVVPSQRGEEQRRLHRAFAEAADDLEGIRAHGETEEATAILAAHIDIVRDPELMRRIDALLMDEGHSAEDALYIAAEQFAVDFEAMEDPYMQERAADVRDVAQRVYRRLVHAPEIVLTEESIVAAEDMTPSLLTSLDRTCIKGILSGTGGLTSHVAILAGGMGIPAVLGLGEAMHKVEDGMLAIVDGESGEAILSPDARMIEECERRRAEREAKQQEEEAYRDKVAVTKDGAHRVAIHANVNFLEEGQLAAVSGVEGIGLFRTEFLFFNRDNWPTEEEQCAAYRHIAELMAPKTVTIRTMDIGGDKELSYMGLQKEDNPFLGYRALRLSLGRPKMFRTQLRALLRASAFGTVRIMFPMVSHPEEFREAKAHLLACMEELDNEGVPYDKDVQVGAMIEIPAAALLAEELAREADFFSIGTNDLIQHTMAVDRLNNNVADLYDCYQPAVLRLIQATIEGAHRHHIPVAMCGEMAGYEDAAKILVGMGLDEFSMSWGQAAKIKKAISSFTYEEAQELAAACLTAGGVQEVRETIRRMRPMERMKMSERLAFVGKTYATREDLIRAVGEEALRLGYVTEEYVEDVIAREEEFPTGLIGALPIAIPHVGSHCNVSFMSVTTMKEPLPFAYMNGTEGTLEVRVVFVFGLVNHNDQVNVLKKLTQLFRDEDGMRRLQGARSDKEACALIAEYLGELIEVV